MCKPIHFLSLFQIFQCKKYICKIIKIFAACMLSHVWLSVTAWTVARQAPLSVAFSRQEHWSGLPFCSPVDLPNIGIQPMSPALQVSSLLLSHQGRHHNLATHKSYNMEAWKERNIRRNSGVAQTTETCSLCHEKVPFILWWTIKTLSYLLQKS